MKWSKLVKLEAPIVIIGSGLAGYTVIREIRKLNQEIPVTLITREPAYFYSKPMLSTAIAGRKEPMQLITGSREDMAAQLGITILAQTEVTAIDIKNQIITSAQGNISYTKLVLALGADQIRLPLQGDAADQVISVNDLEEYRSFRERITNKKRIAILGAGLIGTEFANDLIAGGYTVDIIDLANQPLGRLLPPSAAAELKRELANAGVSWHFETTIETITHHQDALLIQLKNGVQLVSDVVLSAVGLRPRTTLAKLAGLNTNQGIQVNRRLETSAPQVYALGDCAEVDGLVLPYVMPLMQAARALAPNLLGEEVTVLYPAMPVMVKTPAMPIVVSPPAKDAVGMWESTAQEGGMKACFKSGTGKLLGFALVGTATTERAALAKLLPPVLI
ncbi:NAD(P)/FAD-dependent oxidoreductase [Polynucleobacter sp. IMCC 30228]|uniref:NAD(P)/FAD-dependent oxidoreductase n=1 Tax=Polynucleobacter sp. IMCC 30228 TaxID=2781011 RepID=UPI001F3E1921|nr:FAD-dependent oxidoreductase [Polynucleobacter sp. IMCC 30228]MCE7526920.1 FAD-dependent oxidoreductase [Polynucleobacter sp. IMCC 30228]